MNERTRQIPIQLMCQWVISHLSLCVFKRVLTVLFRNPIKVGLNMTSLLVTKKNKTFLTPTYLKHYPASASQRRSTDFIYQVLKKCVLHFSCIYVRIPHLNVFSQSSPIFKRFYVFFFSDNLVHKTALK